MKNFSEKSRTSLHDTKRKICAETWNYDHKKLLNFDGLGFDHLNIEIKCDPPLTHSNYHLKVSTTPLRFQG